MLHRLLIRNYAIIDKLEIEFSEGMNIITGETGAGKSILLGALNLILGDRADTRVLYNAEEKCVVEADFEIENKQLKSFFSIHELDFDTHTIIRREIHQSGKTRAFINDSPVTLQVLKRLGEQLVNLHSQHETLELTEAGFQLDVLDVLSKNTTDLQEYRKLYANYKAQQKQLDELIAQTSTNSAEQDFLKFQLQEITDCNLVVGEQEKLEDEQNTLSNVEEIKRVLAQVAAILGGAEPSVTDLVNDAVARLKPIKSYSKDLESVESRLHSVLEELKDLNRELERMDSSASNDPERLEELTSRLNAIYRLHKKHQVKTTEDLIRIGEEFQARIKSTDTSAEAIRIMQTSLDKSLKELEIRALKLHETRLAAVAPFEAKVLDLLGKVGMPGGSLKVVAKLMDSTQINRNGLTDVSFLFSANKGYTPLPIKDVASGGELSRLMLCIKSMIADAGTMPTMIFDEIDNGISGEVALKVGEIMKGLSKRHQLISITHLPQIARTADRHLFVYKENKDKRTVTSIKILKGEERVLEIAKMLSGEKISEAALANARELIGN